MARLTLMLKTTGSYNSPQGGDDDEVVRGGGDRNKSKSKFKKSKYAKSGIQTRLGAMRKLTFLTLDARKAFNQLRQAFTKAPIH